MIHFNISSPSALDIFGLLLTTVRVILTVTSAIAGRRLSKDITEVKAILGILQSGILQQFLMQHQSMWTRFSGTLAVNGQAMPINDSSTPKEAEFQTTRPDPWSRFWRFLFLRNQRSQQPGDPTVDG